MMKGTAPSAAFNTTGVAKYSDFGPIEGISRKRCKIEGKLLLITNRKSYMSLRLVSKSVTLNDLEWRNGAYFALFHRICVQCRIVKQNLLFIVYDHINTICAITQRLVGQNKRRQWPPLQTVVAYAHVSWWVSCSCGQVHIVQHSGLDGRVHFNDGECSSGLIQLGLMGVGASISVDV